MVEIIHTIDFFALMRDNPDSVLLGKSVTGLGIGVLTVGGAVSGGVEGVKEVINARRGVDAGTSRNAPENTYATMGASYANNGGATGDLAFALSNQRKTGIL
jgi:hypothetical protein